MTLDDHNLNVLIAAEKAQQEAFDRLAAENGLVPSKEYGSAYLAARYWFSLGYEAGEQQESRY